LQKRIQESTVELILNSVVTEIHANEEGVSSISFQELPAGPQRTIETEGVFIFVGLLPSNQIVPPGIRLDSSGYAITDEKCGTGIPGIYVAGDLKTKFAKQIVVAAAEGCTAALAAADYIDQKKNVMGIFDTRSRQIRPNSDQALGPAYDSLVAKGLQTDPQACTRTDPTH
jgi:thioredoxin reductase (NADPH)